MLVRARIAISAGPAPFGGDEVLALAEALLRKGARAFQLRDPEGLVTAEEELPGWLDRLFALVGDDAPVQHDGATEDSHALERLAAAPFDSIVVGMGGLFEPLRLRWALDLLGPRLVAGLEVDGDYLFDPPSAGFSLELMEAVRQLHFQGVRHVLYRDVTGSELPLQRLQQICGSLTMDVTYSGVVRALGDVEELTLLDPRHFRAVVLGEPLFDGRIDIGEATRIAAGPHR